MEAVLAQIAHRVEAVRRIGARMLPPSLGESGLAAAIESQARSLADAAGWTVVRFEVHRPAAGEGSRGYP